MGSLSISEVEILRLINQGFNTKYKLFKAGNMSSSTIDKNVERMLGIKLLKVSDKHDKRSKPVELTDKGKLALRMLGDLDRVID
jgi:predicted transcriptional regulator